MSKTLQEPDPPGDRGAASVAPPVRLADIRESIGAAVGDLRAPAGAILVKTCGVKAGSLDCRVDDVLQEACARALDRIGDFDASRPIVPWLMGFVIGVIREQRGREARRKHLAPAQAEESDWNSIEDFLIDQGAGAPDELAMRNEESALLGRAMAALTADQRLAINARYFQALEGQKLARRLGVSTDGAARVRVHRALRALQQNYAALDRQEVVQ